MIALFTDFGPAGPYLGQVKAVLAHQAPHTPVIDLFADLPSHNAKAAAYLLPAFASALPRGTVFLCVVDPGVGGARMPAVVEAEGRWYVGPDNGLFELVVRRADNARRWHITWRPPRLSASFHGRDLFAPVAAMLARGEAPPGEPRPTDTAARADWPDDLAEVAYIDHFGNAMTGLRATRLSPDAVLVAAGRRLTHARTFSDVSTGSAFWYENANGLVEIAVNQGRADVELALGIGTPVSIADGGRG